MLPPDESGEYTPSAVKVYVRVRPFIEREISLGETDPIVTPHEDSTQNIKILDPNSSYKPRDVCSFDACWFSMPSQKSFPFVSQDDIYDVTGAVACENVFAGYNSCIFAYGQTGSGKTYTMMGELMDSSERGIIPRVCETLLRGCARSGGSLELQCTYYEIYNERVMDLLDRSSRNELKVRNDPLLGPYVEGISAHHIHRERDVMHLLSVGNKERHTALTKMNKQSSRSHAVLTLQLMKRDSKHNIFSKINLVDLAGSERTSVSEVEGLHFKEATKINLSLTTLGRVIDALADQASGNATTLPPYRDSLLTWLLSDSLGGNSKTCMIATVSPAAVNFDETLNTLRYASRAREIINICVTNDDPYEKRVKELTMLVEHLRKQLAAQNAQGRGSHGSQTDELFREPVDEETAKHYQDVISKLHQQVNKLSQDNEELERKLKDERAAHEITIQNNHTESTVLQKEVKMLRSISSMDVLALKKGTKCLDLTSLNGVGRKSYESNDGSGLDSSRSRDTHRPRTSMSRYEMPIRQSRERPPVDSIEHIERMIERYTRELGKLQKEYCAKGNEIIEIYATRLTKSAGSRTLTKANFLRSQRLSGLPQGDSLHLNGQLSARQSARASLKKKLSLSKLCHFSAVPKQDKKSVEKFQKKIVELEKMHEKEMDKIRMASQQAEEQVRKDTERVSFENAKIIEKSAKDHKQVVEALYTQFDKAKQAHSADLVLRLTENFFTLETACRKALLDQQAENFKARSDLFKIAFDWFTQSAKQISHSKENIQKLNENHREEVQSIQKEFSEEKLRVTELLTSEKQSLETEHQCAMETLSSEHASQFTRNTEAHQAAMETLKSQHLAREKSLLESHKSTVKAQSKAQHDAIATERRAHKSDMEQLENKYQQRTDELIQAHVEELRFASQTSESLSDTFRAESEQKIRSMEQNFASQIEEIEKTNQRDLCARQEEFAEREKSLLQSHKEHVNTLRLELDEKMKAERGSRVQQGMDNQVSAEAELQTLRESHQTAMESESRRHAAEVRSLMGAHSQAINALQSESSGNVAEIRQKAESERVVTAAAHQEELTSLAKASTEALEAAQATAQVELQTLRKSYESMMKNESVHHAENKQALIDAHNATVKDMLQKVESERAETTAAHQETVAALKTESVETLESLRAVTRQELQVSQKSHESAMESETCRHQVEKQSLIDARNEAIEALQRENSTKIMELLRKWKDERTETAATHEKEVTALRKESDGVLEDLRTSTEKEFKTLRKAHATAMETESNRNAAEKEIVIKTHNRELEAAHSESCRNTSKVLQEAESKLSATAEKHEEVVQTLKKESDEALAAQQNTTRKELHLLRESHEAASANESKKHEVEKQSLTESHNEAIEALQRENSTKVMELLRKWKDERAETAAAHEKEVTAFRKKSDKALEGLRTSSEEELQTLRKAHKLSVETESNRHATEKQSLTDAHVKAINATKAEYSTQITEVLQKAENERVETASTHQAEIVALKKESNDALEVLRTAAKAELRALHESHNSNMKSESNRHAEEKQVLVDAHRRALDALRTESSDKVTEILQNAKSEQSATAKKHEEVVNALKKESDEALEAQQSAIRKELQLLRESHERVIAGESRRYQDEKQSMVDAQKEKLDVLQSESSKKVKDILQKAQSERAETASTHEKEVTALRKKSDKALEGLRASTEKELQALQKAHATAMETELDRHAAEKEILTKTHNKELEAAHSENCANISKVLQGAENRLSATTKKHEEVVQTLKKESDEALAAQQSATRKELQLLHESHESVIADESKKHQDEKQSLIDAHKEKLDALRSESSSKVKDILQKAQSERAETTSAHEKEVAALRKKSDKALEGLRASTENELQTMRKFHETAMETESNRHVREKESLIDAHAETISTMKSENFTKMTEVLQKAENKRVETASTHQVEIAVLKNKSDKALEVLRASTEKELQTLRKTHEAAIETECSRHAREKESLIKLHGHALEALQNENSIKMKEIVRKSENERDETSSIHQKEVIALRKESNKALEALRTDAEKEKSKLTCDFTARIESFDKTSTSLMHHSLRGRDSENTLMCKKHAVILETLAQFSKKTIQERAESSLEANALRQEVKSQTTTAQRTMRLSALQASEAKNRLMLFGVEIDKVGTLHRSFVQEKARIDIKAVRRQAEDTLRSEQNRLTSECEKFTRALSTAKKTHACDLTALEQKLRIFEVFMQKSRDTITEWHQKQYAVVQSFYSAIRSTEHENVQKAHTESIRRITETNERDRENTSKRTEKRVKVIQSTSTTIQRFIDDERAARACIATEETQSVQRFYGIRLKASIERERNLKDIIGVLEAASEVAADSAKEQQAHIRKLESSIALYKVLQLEGELGMQSGII